MSLYLPTEFITAMSGLDPLHDAVARGAVEEIEDMIGYSDIRYQYLYVNEITDTGFSPLMIAAMQEDDDEEDDNDDGNELDSSGHTPLMVSDKENRQTRIMRILLDANADPNAVGAHIENFDENGESSALMWAALQGSITAMRVLIDANADVNLKCDSSWPTALFCAAEAGSCEKIQLLLDAKASTGINITNEKQETAADIAETRGHHNIVQLLLDAKATPRDDWNRIRDACIEGRTEDVKSVLDAGYRLDVPNFRGLDPLLLAAKHGHADIGELLIAAGAEVNVLDEDDMTPLMHSAARGDVKLSKLLIDAGADASGDEYKKTPLICAVKNGHADIIRLLIDAKAPLQDLSYTGDFQDDALPFAVRHNKLNIIKVLIDAKAPMYVPETSYTKDLIRCAIDTCAKYDDDSVLKLLLENNASSIRAFWGKAAIREACISNRPSVLKILLDQRISPEHVYEKKYPYTLLMKAASENYIDVGKLLIAAKANINRQLRGHQTALMVAAKRDNAKFVQMLIENKASLDITDVDGRTAVRNAGASSLKILADAKASLEVRDTRGHTPLLHAAMQPLFVIVKDLLDVKADTDARCHDGLTPLMHAIRIGSANCIEILLGARSSSFDAQDNEGKTALMHALCSNKDNAGSRGLRMLLVHAMTHCVVECNENEPPAKRCKRTE